MTLTWEDLRVAAEYFIKRLSLLLMLEQNKSHVVDARFLSRFLHGFVKVMT